MTHHRNDVQILRGLAVGAVLLYHANLVPLPGGYLGVDIFFVISGFLITGLVRRDMEAGRFSFREFYFRRAKRLLPAAYTTFFFTALLSLLFLDRLELGDLALQLAGGVTYTANFVLWQQTDYFQVASEFKPLLHIWSLAVEEQYYLLLPLALMLAGRRRWLALALGVTMGSVLLCAVGSLYKPVATFYLLPTRAWELGIGSIGALLVGSAWEARLRQAARWLFAPAVAALLIIPVFPIGGPHPGADALVVCIATLVVILREYPLHQPGALGRAMVGMGDISYSLYLVHWPLIAIANNAWVGSHDRALPLPLRLALLLASVALAWLQYRYVEAPLRAAALGPSFRIVWRTLAASVALVAVIPAAGYALPDTLDFKHIRRANYGLSEECEFTSAPFTEKPACRTSERPRVLVWGDSYAMHLVPGLAVAMQEHGLVQATMSGCGPFIGLAPMRPVHPRQGIVMDEGMAHRCHAFNDSVLAYLEKHPSIEIVVLSSPFGAAVTTAEFRHVVRDGVAPRVVDARTENGIAAMKRTVDALRAAGKRAVVVAPPPAADFNIGACLERMLGKRLSLGAPPGCEVDVRAYRATRGEVLQFLERLPAEAGVHVVRLDDHLCQGGRCRTMMEGTLLYRDWGHLTHDGSRLLAERLNLAAQILAQAR